MKSFRILIAVLALIVSGCGRDDAHVRIKKLEEEIKRLSEAPKSADAKTQEPSVVQKKDPEPELPKFSGYFYRDGYRYARDSAGISRPVPSQEEWDFRADGTVTHIPFHRGGEYRYTYTRKDSKIEVDDKYRFELEPNGDLVYKELRVRGLGWEPVNKRLTKR
jgi:hypothetical protein